MSQCTWPDVQICASCQKFGPRLQGSESTPNALSWTNGKENCNFRCVRHHAGLRRPIGAWHQSTARLIQKQRFINQSRGTLMPYSEHRRRSLYPIGVIGCYPIKKAASHDLWAGFYILCGCLQNQLDNECLFWIQHWVMLSAGFSCLQSSWMIRNMDFYQANSNSSYTNILFSSFVSI